MSKEINEEIEQHLNDISKCLKGSPPLLLVALNLATEAVEQQCDEIQLAIAKQLTQQFGQYVTSKVTQEQKLKGEQK